MSLSSDKVLLYEEMHDMFQLNLLQSFNGALIKNFPIRSLEGQNNLIKFDWN